jgi:glycosyltransferase involved in cell wall biosynthesis
VIADNEQNYSYATELGLRSEQRSALGVVPGTGGVDVERLAGSWSSIPSARRDIVWPKAYNCPQSIANPVFEGIKMAWARVQPCEIHMLASTPETRMWFQTLPDELRRHCHIEEWISRTRLLELMTRSRVMLAPSLIDGVPNSMYEAMAAGALPIVSPLDTIRPFMTEPDNALFARNLYPDEIASALERAMTDDKLVDAAAEKNLALVRRIANRNEIRVRVMKFYENLAE